MQATAEGIVHQTPRHRSGLYLPAAELARQDDLNRVESGLPGERRPLSIPAGDFKVGTKLMRHMGTENGWRAYWEARGRNKKGEHGLSIFLRMEPGDPVMHCHVGYAFRWPSVETLRAVAAELFAPSGWKVAYAIPSEADLTHPDPEERARHIPFHVRLFNVDDI